MPFFDHIAELRRRLMVLFVVIGLMSLGAYFLTDQIYTFLLAPVSFLFESGKAITLSPLEAMTIRFKLGLWAAVVAGFPIIIWQVFAFFLPALKPKERRWFVPTFVIAVVLFFVGCAFCYKLILPPSMQWLVSQNGEIFQLLPKGAEVITVVTFFLIGFGLAFETPIVVFYLVYFGVVSYEKLRKNWRVVYVVISVIAAGVTPDWSPVSMGALAGAMIALYEISMFLVRVLLSRKIARQRLAEAE